jgi:hypothetical protein
MGLIGILDRFEYEYRPPRRTEYEYEYEKNRETKHWTEVLD